MLINLYADTLIFRMQRIGGISVYWYEMLKRALSDIDIDVTLIDAPGNEASLLYPEIASMAPRTIPCRWDNLFAQRVSRVNIRPSTHDPVVFHSSYYRTATGLGVKNVLTIHDFTHQLYFKGYKKWLNDCLKDRAIRYADSIVCISENTKRDLLHYFPAASKKSISVVYNGVGECYCQLDNSVHELERKFPDLIGRRYLLYVGARSGYKNFSFVRELMKAISGFDLVVVGGEPFDEDELLRLGISMGCDIFSYKYLDDRDLNVLYNGAHAFIYPSYYEGFGIPILEAMRAGCPVIAFSNSAIPEVLGSSPLLLENDDLETCIDRIGLLCNKAFREEIVSNQLRRAKEFDWDTTYKGVKQVYENLVS